jgi:hypothetical protein
VKLSAFEHCELLKNAILVQKSLRVRQVALVNELAEEFPAVEEGEQVFAL